MRNETSRLRGSGLAGALIALLVTATAHAQPGTVVGHHLISDRPGNFTGQLGNLDEFGGAVANLGDLDGAGPSVAAVAVGAFADDDGGTDRGAVYILFLSGTGSVLSFQKISDTQGNFTATIDNADEFGCSVASLGDLDGAGPSVAALAVGSVGDDDGGLNHGAIYILFLNSAGSVLSYQKISDTAGNFLQPLDTADEFGSAITTLRDLDGPGPGVAAVAVSAVGDDDGGTDRGAAYVLFLASTGNVLSYQKISDTAGGFLETLDDFDAFGSSLVHPGDLDGIGPSVAALAVGASFDDDGGSNRGAIYILFLNGAGSVLSSQKISNTRGGFGGVIANEDEFGGSVANLGDLDGSGPSVTALAVGAVGDNGAGSGRGATYVLYLSGTGVVSSFVKIGDGLANFTGALLDGDQFGTALAALGDIDGAGGGVVALVVGAPGDDDGGFDRGAVYVLRLAGSAVADVGDLPPSGTGHGLGLARPNPFGPTTTIPFTIRAPGLVRIHVCDIQGRLVRRLLERQIEPGEHTAEWDGRDESGRPVSSGNYFYRMWVDGRSVTAAKRVLLVR